MIRAGRLPATVLAMALSALVAGCDFPSDPDVTLERVRNSGLRVGIIAGHPVLPGEADALRRIAERLGVEIETREGEAHRLVDDLVHGRLDMIAGALPTSTPFRHKIALTKPVGSTELGGEPVDTAFAVPQGENRFLLHVNAAISGTRP